MEFTNPASVPNWQAYGLSEYLLIAHPDEAVNEKVVAEKRKFYYRYHEATAIKTKPHITVAAFLGKASMEQRLNDEIQKACQQQRTFTTVLDNFKWFAPHTIYLNIQNHQPFKQLAKWLKVIDSYIRSNNCPPVWLVDTPHLTIARRVPYPIYYQAIQTYAHRSFYASFSIDELILIKRRHQYDPCRTVSTFYLLPPPPKQDPSVQLKLDL